MRFASSGLHLIKREHFRKESFRRDVLLVGPRHRSKQDTDAIEVIDILNSQKTPRSRYGLRSKIPLREKDHNPPHVHLMGPDFEAAINLETLEVMDGSAPTKVLRHAIGWIADNRKELITQWRMLHG